jgi:hypothetical protein
VAGAVAEFDRRDGCSIWECRSCAHWFKWKCGIDLGTARQKVRVAHALRCLPLVTEAFAAGRLSYSKVRALTRVATPENEPQLLELALTGTAAHLERIVRAYRGALGADEVANANRVHERRGVQWFHDDDGSLVLTARLEPEQGALVRRALEAATEAGENGSAEPFSPGSDASARRRADSLTLMAESFLVSGAKAAGGGRHVVTVHVDAQVLAAGGEGRCELDDGPAVAAETARRLACDAAVVGIMEDELATPLDVGRKTRSIPPAIRRALHARDGGCRFPGCANRRFVDGHHIRHWAAGGETSLANLVLLCRPHRRAVHEGGYTIEAAGDAHGRARVRRPDGTLLAAAVPPAATDHRVVVEQNRRLGIDVDQLTTTPGWVGEPLDLDLCVEGLLVADG